jgi:hypothetical protein
MPADPRGADLAAFRLTDPHRWERFPPPLPENALAGIRWRLVASAN